MKKNDTKNEADTSGDRRMIPVDLIDLNPWNGHREADSDLTASIAQHGILQNLIVRPAPGGFEVISGSRRLDAARKAKLDAVPCLVCALSDHEARTITIIENLQRENLHPVAEAQAIAALLNDYTTDEVAARIGKTTAFVTRRAKLSLLAPEIIEQAGADIQRASVRALELLATLPREQQTRLWEDYGGVTIGAEDLARRLSYDQKAIAGALFDCTDATLHPEAGACTNCPKRTGADLKLFEDLESLTVDDRCLDSDCFERKHALHLARAEAAARQKHGDKLMLAATYLPYGEEGTELKKRGTVELGREWKPCKKNEPGARPALMVYGPDRDLGKTIYVKQDPKPEAPADAPPADSVEAKRQRLEQRRWAWMATELTNALRENPYPAKRYINEASLARMAAAFGGWVHDDGLEFWAREKPSAHDMAARIWHGASEALRRALQVARVTELTPEFVERLKVVADLVDQKWSELEADAIEAIPEPKAWAK